MTALNQD